MKNLRARHTARAADIEKDHARLKKEDNAPTERWCFKKGIGRCGLRMDQRLVIAPFFLRQSVTRLGIEVMSLAAPGYFGPSRTIACLNFTKDVSWSVRRLRRANEAPLRAPTRKWSPLQVKQPPTRPAGEGEGRRRRQRRDGVFNATDRLAGKRARASRALPFF